MLYGVKPDIPAYVSAALEKASAGDMPSAEVPVGPTERGPLCGGGREVEGPAAGKGEFVADGTADDVGRRARLEGDGVVDIFAAELWSSRYT